jgi:large subunit ribosomal protein L2
MKIKKIVNFNSSVRHQICLKKYLLTKYNLMHKNLSIFKKSQSGRNNTGRITIRHQGAGCKKLTHYFKQNTIFYKGITICIMYNAKSNAFVSLIFDLKNKKFFKTITVKNVLPGSLINSSLNLKDFRLGYKTILKKMPLGTLVNSISKNNKITFAKSAGSFSQLIDKNNKIVKLRLPSGKIITLSNNEYGSFGLVDNIENKITKVGKAGRNRLIGIRPSVRGIAMNPVDHPHGGKSNKGKPPVTPWGLPTKNYPTVKNKKYE